MAEDYEKIKLAGAELITISVDNQSFAWSMALSTGAKYQILSDSDHKVVEAYGILNAAEHGGIAKPSSFLVGKDGRVYYAYVGKEPTDRPPDEVLLQEIKKLAGK